MTINPKRFLCYQWRCHISYYLNRRINYFFKKLCKPENWTKHLLHMGKLRPRGANGFSRSQWHQWQSWYHPRPLAHRLTFLPRPGRNVPLRRWQLGAEYQEGPIQRSGLDRSLPTLQAPCEAPGRIVAWKGGSALDWRLEVLKWEGQAEGEVWRRSRGQGFILWVPHICSPNQSTDALLPV